MAELILINDDNKKISIEFEYTGHIDSIANNIRALLLAQGFTEKTVDTHILCEYNDYGSEYLDVEEKNETP